MGIEGPEKASPKRPNVINLCAIIITCATFLIIGIVTVVFFICGNHKPSGTGTLYCLTVDTSISLPAFWL